MIVTKPGIYNDFDEAEYHSDPIVDGSLSASGAKLLLDPHCPAHYYYDRTHPSKRTKALDAGSIAHGMILGTGAKAIAYPESVLSCNGAAGTKAAKEFKETHEADGYIVVKQAELDEITAMVESVRNHPVAGGFFQAGTGKAEQSLFWKDTAHGIWRRARLDWLPTIKEGTRSITIADLKTARTANPRDWLRHAVDFGYAMQAANYIDGVRSLTGIESVRFVFVIVEKDPPYVPVVIELDDESLQAGAELMNRAADVFARCKSTNTWPGYCDDQIVTGSLPGWYLDHIYDDAIEV
ncbi:PD-(D/E)XK nuclease-like domain-containing protein [Propionimicrobium sp. PCR01-08-3]|uniref:PD-(D/E)XK nuclease-like domain-containing protein n=1 Tax=Propionimicrobium sp. PCR01-08-3 TaxID=3052086 RepID=UPI00255C62E9|nr:PD-(D/E)XK nuclease-like domain-containing protein [Propionimicrobium sp. PCR01-08-3]WIY84306.1 PD-(D/E)XK nuclease-like domain-containing protein [Propionimicrobium sp. PCR01-08-3]